ncbi:MAG: hypothetical protein QOG77_2005 [Solirubrobacteraceae bacterium]|jgi:hypothetical protein|nr:hypothetical protein [Solirubrobacteraceae bacterium]MEA2267557.1 hypothetical protein [Solirubrobacteraceae bacterium]
MRDDWTGRPFPSFALEAVDGGRWDDQRLLGRRAVFFCFASW